MSEVAIFNYSLFPLRQDFFALENLGRQVQHAAIQNCNDRRADDEGKDIEQNKSRSLRES